MSLILKQFLQTSNRANVEAINKFRKEKLTNSTFYDQVNALQRSELVYYLAFAVIVLYIFSRIKIDTNMILASFIIVGAVYYWINNSNNTLENDAVNFRDKLRYLESMLFSDDDSNKRKNPFKNILNTLPNNMPPEHKSYLHMSHQVVEFYFSIRELSQYNPATYAASLRAMNNLLQLNITMEVGAARPKYTLDNALIQRDKCLNALQATIYSIPSNYTYNKFFNDSLKTLQKILALYTNAMTDAAKEHYETEVRNNDLDINSHQIIRDEPNANDTKAFDYSPNYNFF